MPEPSFPAQAAFGSFASGRPGGKRGGYRIIYFAKPEQGLIWMLTMYPKNVKDDIPAKALRQIRNEVEHG